MGTRKVTFFNESNPELDSQLEKEYPEGTSDEKIQEDFDNWLKEELSGAIGWYDNDDCLVNKAIK